MQGANHPQKLSVGYRGQNLLTAEPFRSISLFIRSMEIADGRANFDPVLGLSISLCHGNPSLLPTVFLRRILLLSIFFSLSKLLRGAFEPWCSRALGEASWDILTGAPGQRSNACLPRVFERRVFRGILKESESCYCFLFSAQRFNYSTYILTAGVGEDERDVLIPKGERERMPSSNAACKKAKKAQARHGRQEITYTYDVHSRQRKRSGKQKREITGDDRAK